MMPNHLRLTVGCFVVAVTVRAQSTDTTGCYLEPGSDLRRCLGSYVSIPPAAPTGLVAVQEAAYYCTMYQQMADCWAIGTYCREWLPLQVAADKFCALANGTQLVINGTTSVSLAPASATSSSLSLSPMSRNTTSNATSVAPSLTANATVNPPTLSSVLAEASNVVTSIWNNDVGTAIPSITDDIGRTTLPTWTKMSTKPVFPVTDPFNSTTVPFPTATRSPPIAVISDTPPAAGTLATSLAAPTATATGAASRSCRSSLWKALHPSWPFVFLIAGTIV